MSKAKAPKIAVDEIAELARRAEKTGQIELSGILYGVAGAMKDELEKHLLMHVFSFATEHLVEARHAEQAENN